MKLKALLLGSAAAMLAVSGAHAADAVVAEPEPVDYVKVCDMYGAGWWYIPGTETCLKMDGLVRSTFAYDTGDAGSNTAWTYRARLNVHAREETDYGTLNSTIRIQGDGNGGGDANAVIDRALISLGGFRLGYTDTVWTTNSGYGAPGAIQDGYYGFDQAVLADYTFAANGFSATIGVQDTDGNAEEIDFVAGVSYAGSGFLLAAVYGYDAITNDGAYKVTAQATLMDGLTVKGIYSAALDNTSPFLSTANDYEWIVGMNWQATDMVNVYANIHDSDDPANQQRVVVGMGYKITSNLRMQAEVGIEELNDTTDFRLRVTRSF